MEVSSFQRAVVGGAFEVAMNGVSDMNEIIPPARINDLRRGHVAENRLKRGQMAENSLALMWTAVGESMNDGTGNAYLLSLLTVSYLLSENR